jgi:hypothetical protein
MFPSFPRANFQCVRFSRNGFDGREKSGDFGAFYGVSG